MSNERWYPRLATDADVGRKRINKTKLAELRLRDSAQHLLETLQILQYEIFEMGHPLNFTHRLLIEKAIKRALEGEDHG